jgi:adenylate kinase
VKRRLAIYREQTEPLERYYEDRGLLREVDAEALMDSVTEGMLAALGDAV